MKDDRDDGHTIAPMNVEGMPWYREDTPRNPDAEPISKQNARRYAGAAVAAGLVIVCIFGLAAALFIWLCCNVWFV